MSTQVRQSHLGLRNWYVADQTGLGHVPRESEGEHHSAMCGKYVRGEARPMLHDRTPKMCHECLKRSEVGYALMLTAADAEDEVPEAVRLGRGLVSRRIAAGTASRQRSSN